MKSYFPAFAGIVGVAIVLCGCGKSESPTSNTTGNESTSTTAPAATSNETSAMAGTETTSAESAIQKPLNVVSELVSKAKSATDPQLAPIADELATKVKSLESATPNQDAARTQVTDTIKSLVNGDDSAALKSAFELAKIPALTPQQTGLAKEVGNVASAYVVQRNFAGLEGSQSDVATIVTSLRNGQPAAAVPALKSVAQNARLTSQQKELISSLADQYAPGLKKAASAASEGLDTLKKLPALGK